MVFRPIAADLTHYCNHIEVLHAIFHDHTGSNSTCNNIVYESHKINKRGCKGTD